MISQEYALSHKDECAVINGDITKNTLITADILEDPENFQYLIDQGLLTNLENCLKIGQVLDYSKLVVNCNNITPLTTDKINTYKQRKISYEEDNDYKTIEYITLPPSQSIEGGTYEIADKTWRNSPARGIKQGDIIHWHKMQNLTLTSDDIGERIVPLTDNYTIDPIYLPSYVDDVIEGYLNNQNGNFYKENYFHNKIDGETGKIYIDLNSNKSYRYTPNAYIEISGVIDTSQIEADISNLQDAIVGIRDTINSLPTEEEIQTIIEENSGIGCTLRQVTVSSIAVSANNNYAFSIKETIPSIEGYIPLSIAGYHLSVGEVNLNKLYINEGDIEAAGTVSLNGESSFNMTFDIYYVLDTKFIPQEDESEF